MITFRIDTATTFNNAGTRVAPLIDNPNRIWRRSWNWWLASMEKSIMCFEFFLSTICFEVCSLIKWNTQNNSIYCKEGMNDSYYKNLKLTARFIRFKHFSFLLIWFSSGIVRFLSASLGAGWRLLVEIGTAGIVRKSLPFVRFSVRKKEQVICRMNDMLLKILGSYWKYPCN